MNFVLLYYILFVKKNKNEIRCSAGLYKRKCTLSIKLIDEFSTGKLRKFSTTDKKYTVCMLWDSGSKCLKRVH